MFKSSGAFGQQVKFCLAQYAAKVPVPCLTSPSVGEILPTPKSSVKGLSTVSQDFIEKAKLLGVPVCVLSRGLLLDCSSPGSSVLWNFQARILEWVSISYSREPSQFDRTRVWRLRHWQAASFPLHHLGSPKYLINICANCQKLPGCCWSLTSQMN